MKRGKICSAGFKDGPEIQEWQCAECGYIGTGWSGELQAHLKTHLKKRVYDNCSNLNLSRAGGSRSNEDARQTTMTAYIVGSQGPQDCLIAFTPSDFEAAAREIWEAARFHANIRAAWGGFDKHWPELRKRLIGE